MNIKDFAQPTILTGKQYGTTITIELDHSDTSIDEVMDGFLTIAKGLGYLETTINEWIKDKSKDIYEEEHQLIKDSLTDDLYDIDETGAYHTDKDWEELYNGGNIIDWDTADDKRMDIIGQNGNEGTHYGLATDEDIEECKLNEAQLKDYKGVYVQTPSEDEDQYDDYGQLIPTNRPHFKWDEDEEEDWFDEVPNDKLKEAAKQYSEKVRSNHTPIKEQKVLGKWQTDNRTKEVVKLDKTKVRKGKIKDLKK